MNTTHTLTPASLALFIRIAKSHANDFPLLEEISKEERGNLTDLKKLALVETYTEDGCVWTIMTEAGRKLSLEHGIDFYVDYPHYKMASEIEAGL